VNNHREHFEFQLSEIFIIEQRDFAAFLPCRCMEIRGKHMYQQECFGILMSPPVFFTRCCSKYCYSFDVRWTFNAECVRQN